MKSLGATEVVDYSKEEVWDAVADNSVDVVYNNYNGKGNADIAMRKLKRGGFYIAIIGPLSSRPKPGVVQKTFLVNATRPRDLEVISALLETGFVRPHVDSEYDLEEAGHALAELEEGATVGKIAIIVAP